MSKKHFVYSTLSSATHYVNHQPGPDLPLIDGDGVLIAGGANVQDARGDTPAGVVTPVSQEELEYLMANHLFQTHLKNGFIVVSGSKVDPEVVAADMEQRDPSAPVVDADLDKGGPQPAGAGDGETTPAPAPARSNARTSRRA